MTIYTLTVKIPGRGAIEHFAQQGFKLCFACGVEGEGFKVIASSTQIAPNIRLQWNDDYGIAASNSTFMKGTRIQAMTNVSSIKSGQTYTLTPDYQGRVSDGGPETGFQFNNQADRASPIVYRTINGSKAPIYVGSEQLPQGSSQEIQPSNRVAVWFQQQGESGTMMDGIRGQDFEIDMSGKTSATVVFSDDFRWSLQQ